MRSTSKLIPPSFADGLLDILYPRFCACCGESVDRESGHFCWDCRTRLAVVTEPMCSRCGDPVDGRVYHSYRCSWCTSGRIHFERARSALVYNGTAKRAIQQFKYNAFLSLADDFCEYLNACVKTHYSDVVIDAVVPVPLHGKRQRERSFNQSEVLGRRLAQRLRTPFHGGCLIRCKYTGSQTELNARQRRANVKGAFRVRRKERVQERSILLVDDVMTTGATTNECARVLKGAGAVEVNVVTVGRG